MRTNFISINIIQVLLVIQFIVLKGIFTIRMFAGKFHDQAIVQVPFKVWIFLFQYRLFFYQSCIRSSRDLLFSTYSYGTVYTYWNWFRFKYRYKLFQFCDQVSENHKQVLLSGCFTSPFKYLERSFLILSTIFRWYVF